MPPPHQHWAAIGECEARIAMPNLMIFRMVAVDCFFLFFLQADVPCWSMVAFFIYLRYALAVYSVDVPTFLDGPFVIFM